MSMPDGRPVPPAPRQRPTLYLDIETMPMGWEAARDEIAAGHAPAFAMEVALRKLIERSPPRHYGVDAQGRWWQREIASAEADALELFRSFSVEPKRGYVLCVGGAWDDADPWCLWEGTERDTLEVLLGMLEARRPSRIVAWRGWSFDFPFLWERSVGYGLHALARWFHRPHYSAFRELNLRRAPAVLVDPQALWNTVRGGGVGASGGPIRAYLGIDEENPITGGDVFDRVVAGDTDTVREHCLANIRELRRVWRDHVAPAVGAVV